MRSFIVAAVAVLAFATGAGAANAPTSGSYQFDAHGKCRAAGGQLVPSNMCHGPPEHPLCKQGVSKPCGHGCIPLNKTCQK
jgi:hypothetical protein